MATKVRVLQGVLTATTAVTDLTASGLGTPTGCVVIATYATALNTDTAHACLGFGVSDFTTTAAITTNAENGIGTTADNAAVHQDADVLEIHDVGTGDVNRSCTITTTTDGIRLTPNESGTQYQVMAIVFWGTDCHAFSAGAGTLLDNTYDVAHGFSTNRPKAGIFFYTAAHNSQIARWQMGTGFFTDTGTIAQTCWMHNALQTIPTAPAGRIMTDRCCGFSFGGTGGIADAIEITANGATNTTFTARTSDQGGDLVGLLLELDDVGAYLETIDTPTSAASDWTEAGATFTPQVVIAFTSMLQTVDTNESAEAGSSGVWAFDDQNNAYSACNAFEDNVSTTDASCRMDSKLFFIDDNAATTFDMAPSSNPMNANGFTIAAADITTVNGTARKWPMLFIGKFIIDSVSGDDNVPTTENPWQILGAGFGAD